MMPASPAIRVRPLTSMLDGNDPVEFVHRLFNAGYDRFYVKIPQGFQASLHAIDPFPPAYQLLGPYQPATARARPDRDQSQIRYLQLDTAQMKALVQYLPVKLEQLSGGCLESIAPARDGLLSIDFKYRKLLLRGLVPTDASVADKVPTEFNPRAGAPVVVKTLNDFRRGYSYVLHGVSIKDLFVEELALRDALEGMLIAQAASASVDEDLPDDPYGLKESSPVVYEIFCTAYRNRDEARTDLVGKLELVFRKLNAKYKKNPKPFNNGRHRFAANLANHHYKYKKNRGKARPPESPVEVPHDEFFEHKFVNGELRKVLYAACCWSGDKEPRLEGEGRWEALVDLLVGLGFRDANDSDSVQSSIFFITGEMYQRNKHKSDFRHIPDDRK